MSDSFLRSSRQASQVFDLGGPDALRSKHLFFAYFTRNGAADQNGGGAAWQRSWPFLLKSVDRPTLSPITEELNQYGRKQLIHTGYKIQPVRIVMYDTVSGAGDQMWAEYSRHHFADFRRSLGNGSEGAADGFRYDATMATMAEEWGSVLPPDGVAAESAHWFFDRLVIGHLHGGRVTTTTLIHPRITEFAPDDLDREASSPSTISLTVQAEAVLTADEGSLDNLPVLAEAFGLGGKYNANTIEVSGEAASLPTQGGGGGGDGGNSGDGGGWSGGLFSRSGGGGGGLLGGLLGSARTGGALSSFGSYSFGGGAMVDTLVKGLTSGDTKGLAPNLAYAATGSPMLSSLLGTAVNTGRVTGRDVASAALSQMAGSGSLSPMLYDVARSAIGAPDAATMSRGMTNAVIGGVLAAGALSATSPRDQVVDAVSTTSQPDGGTVRGNGNRLSPDAYALVNARRGAQSQIGYNPRAATAVLPDGDVITWNQPGGG